jgi:hypothetical protein
MHPVQYALIAIVLAIGFDYLVLADIAQSPDTNVFPPRVWGLICVFSTPLGGLLYVMYGRPPRRAV